ncbi:hypothetical protein QFC22_005315 [Naganishia vaughanmartiniae]|uniref:Uncharacterized protein n=1 Tax=Naganishia vaughanmartiniae TaxID=1424756 RepID=A0ACC2WVB5_9TREE|nr:hypothetical protein QFC22_005315 [Naganishia vaughanmartiniae]
MSSRLPPPIAPPAGGQVAYPQQTIDQSYVQQPNHSYPPNTYPQNSQAFQQSSFPVDQQPFQQSSYPTAQKLPQGQYVQDPPKADYPTAVPQKVSINHISNYHSKDSHREDNTYHPSLSPKQTTEAIVESAVARHHTRVDVLFLKAVWGGIFLSYGGFLEAVVGGSPSANTSNPGLLRLVEGLVFPLGLMLIVLTGMELVTSNMMIIELGVLKRRIPVWGIAYNWVVVCKGMMLGGGPSIGKYIWLDLIGALVGNIVGATILSLSLYWIYLHGNPTPGKITDKERGPDSDSQHTVAPHQGANSWGNNSHFN